MHNIYYLGLSGEHRCPLGYLLLVKPISFQCNLFVLEHFSCEEENERQIPVALYIRLEYSLAHSCYENFMIMKIFFLFNR